MANPVPLTHTTVLGRETLGGIIDFIAFLCGLTAADFPSGSVERTILVRLINETHDEYRVRCPTKGFGEMTKTYLWGGVGGDDPANGDTKFMLPLDFAEMRSGGEMAEVDADGDVTDTIPVMSRENFERSFIQGQSPYDLLRTHLAVIERIDATNKRRIVEIYPAPADGYRLRVPYFSHVEKLVNDGDELEAPVDLHKLIRYASAAEFLMTGRGATEKLNDYRAKAAELAALWLSPDAREKKRPRRIRSFLEHGYAVFEPPVAEPRPRQFSKTTG